MSDSVPLFIKRLVSVSKEIWIYFTIFNDVNFYWKKNVPGTSYIRMSHIENYQKDLIRGSKVQNLKIRR